MNTYHGLIVPRTPEAQKLAKSLQAANNAFAFPERARLCEFAGMEPGSTNKELKKAQEEKGFEFYTEHFVKDLSIFAPGFSGDAKRDASSSLS